jgi:hypothetical protein
VILRLVARQRARRGGAMTGVHLHLLGGGRAGLRSTGRRGRKRADLWRIGGITGRAPLIRAAGSGPDRRFPKGALLGMIRGR